MFLVLLFLTFGAGIVQSSNEIKRINDLIIQQQNTDESTTLFIFNSTWRCSLNPKWNAKIYFYEHDENGSNAYLVDYQFIEITRPSFNIKSYAQQDGDDHNQYDVRVVVYHNCEKDGNYMKFIEKIGTVDNSKTQFLTMMSDINIDNKGHQIDRKDIAEEWVDVEF